MTKLVLTDRTPENEQRVVKQVARTIWACGFHRVAAQFIVEPKSRKDIINMITAYITHILGETKGRRFRELADLVAS